MEGDMIVPMISPNVRKTKNIVADFISIPRRNMANW
jgi:hypothetical protein